MKTRFLVGESFDYTHLTYPYIVSSKPLSVFDPHVRYAPEHFLEFRSDIESIDMPNLISASDSAFAYMPSIKSINLPLLTTVSNYVMQGRYQSSTALEAVEFPSLKQVGNYFMEYYSNLKTFKAENLETVGQYFLDGCNSLESVSLPKLKAFGTCPFSQCSNLKSLDLPALAYVIDYYGSKNTSAYNNYGNGSPLEFLSIPAMESIPYSFFTYYSNLKSVYAPKAKSMLPYAFNATSRLESFYAPELLSIGASCFAYAANFSVVSFPKVVTIDPYGFYGTAYNPSYGSGIRELNLPECLSIGSSAFNGASYLSSVYLPKLKMLGPNAFYYCYNLGSVDLPNLEIVGSSAFYGTGYGSTSGYKGLTYFSAPKASGASEYAFGYCFFLSSVYMPRLQYISNYAFTNCYALEEVDFPLCASLSANVFYNCSNLKTVKLGYGRRSAGLWVNPISIYSTQFVSVSSIENLYFTNAVSISAYAFSNQSKLKRVDIVGDFPDYNGAILSSAFYNCQNLSEVNLDGVIIGSYAFNNCIALSKVSIDNCLLIYSYAFTNCWNISSLSIKMRSNATIYSYAFNSPLLTSVYIENTGTNANVGILTASSIFGSSCSNIKELNLKNIAVIGSIFSSYSYQLDKLTANMAGVANTLSRFFTMPVNSYMLLTATEINAPLNVAQPTNRLTSVSRAFIVSGALSMTFYNNSKIESVYFGTLNGDIVKTYTNAYPFNGSPMTDSTYLGRYGSIYVPESQYDTYINDSGWASLSSRFVSYSSEYYSTILSMFKQY